MTALPTLGIHAFAALAEIAGCHAVWRSARKFVMPGLLSLAAFAWALTFAPSDFVRRAYAASGGVCVTASLVWLWTVERARPDRRNVVGSLILFAPRGT